MWNHLEQLAIDDLERNTYLPFSLGRVANAEHQENDLVLESGPFIPENSLLNVSLIQIQGLPIQQHDKIQHFEKGQTNRKAS